MIMRIMSLPANFFHSYSAGELMSRSMSANQLCACSRRTVAADNTDKMGCTRILTAHRLSTFRRCDRILALDGGRIIEEESYEQLIRKNGCFAELVNRQRPDIGQ